MLVALQVPCAPDRSFYGSGIVLRVDVFKPDASWMRLQALQTLHPLASISVRTSSEAVVHPCLLCASSTVTEMMDNISCPPVGASFVDVCETLSRVTRPSACPWASVVPIRELRRRLYFPWYYTQLRQLKLSALPLRQDALLRSALPRACGQWITCFTAEGV